MSQKYAAATVVLSATERNRQIKCAQEEAALIMRLAEMLNKCVKTVEWLQMEKKLSAVKQF